MKLSRTVYIGFLAVMALNSGFVMAAGAEQNVEILDSDVANATDPDLTNPEQDLDVNARTVTCYVNNARGQTFSAVGVDTRRVAQRALSKCLRVSARCSAAACRY